MHPSSRRSGRSSVLVACLALAGWHIGASAQVSEVEPNDTWNASQLVANPSGAFSIDGARSFMDPSDDFFSFTVRAPGLLQIISSSTDSGADSIMGLFDGAGTLLASNDDGLANGTMSSIEYVVSAGQVGLLSIGFSGYDPSLIACTGTVTQCYDTDGDFVFDTFVPGGTGGSTGWDYALSFSGVSLVPEPSAALMLLPGLGLLLTIARRQQRRRDTAASEG